MSPLRLTGRPVSRVALATTTAAWLWCGPATADERRFQAQSRALAQQDTPPPQAEPFSQDSHLERAQLVREVLARNPSLEAAREAWRAALARYPQATALEDPMLAYTLAPLSLAPGARLGQSVELSQALPFPGKRALRGEMALAEADVMRQDLQAMRLQMALMASMLFDELFVVERALSIQDEHLGLLEQFKKSAEAQYIAGRASQQDPLQAESELSEVLREKVAMEAERERLRARLNGLLHRPPRAPLPPPPDSLPLPDEEPPSSAHLQDEALRLRPELEGLRARLGGGEAAVRMAHREYYPDVRLMAMYNSMFAETHHQYMAGVSLNLPLDFGKREAAVREAQAHLQRLRKQEERLVDEVRVEVDEAHTRVVEARRVTALFRERLLPAARDRVAAARAGFESGRNSFQALVEAERNLRGVELRLQMALADVQRRRAELERATGHVPGLPREGGAR